MRVIGIDLSLTGTGFTVLEQDGKLIADGVLKSGPTKTKVEELERLREIIRLLFLTIDETNAELAVIEGLAFMAHQTTAIMQLAGLNYLLRNALYERSIPFVIVAPSTLKKFVTGKGNSPKDIMMLETYKRWGVSILDNNQCDAYGLARIGCLLAAPPTKINKTDKEIFKLLQEQYGKTEDDKIDSAIHLPQLQPRD